MLSSKNDTNILQNTLISIKCPYFIKRPVVEIEKISIKRPGLSPKC